MKRYIIIATVLFILQFIFSPFVFAQENGESNVTKYTIKEYLEASLPPQEGRKIALDEITGLLIITDTPRNQELARKLIKEWDIGPRQIQIEAKFIEITFTDLDEMGVDWALYRDDHPTMGIIDNESALMGTTAAAAFAGAQNMSGLGFLIGKATMTGGELFTYLKALEQTGKVNLLNAPRITTLSGQMANIQVVRTFPYATSAERTEVELIQEDAGGTTRDIYPVETYEIAEEITGITLEVTPTVIEGSDIVTLDIHPEVSKLSQQVDITNTATFPEDLGWPIIDTRTAQTSVMVRSGETIIIGGLIQDQDQNTVERKIPVLGDIPFIGNLFRYKYESREKKNLVVFLTARLIDIKGEEIR